MQVTAKVTELTAITAPELAAIERFFSGVGVLILAIIAFYGIYRWRKKSSHKRGSLESRIIEHK